MIFKPKVKQKLKKFLVRAPILMFLTVVCLTGHPARADAAVLEQALGRDME